MADRFVHGNEPLDSTSDDSRSSVVQNDQIITEDDQASSSQGNMAHECNSTNTNQNVFDREQNAVENSVTLADYVVEHQKPTVENQHRIGGGMVGLRQNAVDNPGSSSDTGMSSDNVVDRAKKTIEDHQPASGMVDRRQSTVEYTDMDHMVNCQYKKIGIVDRNKATVEDTNEKSTEQQYPSVYSQVVDATSTNRVIDREKSAFQDSQSKKASNLVDRQKRTVEDDTPTTQATGISQHGLPNTTQITGSQLVGGSITQLRNTGNVVDRQKRTVEDDTPSAHGVPFTRPIIGGQPNHHVSSNTPAEIGGNVVDRQKRTVEDDTLSAQVTGVYSHGGADTTHITGMQPNHHVNSNTPAEIAGNVVDRQKKTVEDDTPSGQVTGMNSHGGADTTHITAMQPKHHVSSNTPAEIPDNMVDRQKKTVEDDTPSAQVARVNSHGGADTTPITGSQVNHSVCSSTHLGTAGNMVDRQKRTVEDPAPSAQATDANDGVPNTQFIGGQPNHLFGGAELEQQFKEGCNVVDQRQRTNSHAEAEKWKIQLHVNIACSKDIIDYLPTIKYFEWNKSVVFGRRTGVDIFINDDHTSRDHVELIGQPSPNGQVIFMIRNTSRQGYNLNGENITDTNRWIPLNKGYQIKIAGLIFVVDIIPGRASMENFVMEFTLPQVHHSPVVTIPGPLYPTPYSPYGQPGFYNHYPVPSVQTPANPHGNFVAPQAAHGNYVHPVYIPPNNGMPMQPYWLYGGMQPGQPYLAGNPTNITCDMVEHALQPYEERDGYVKIAALRYLAREAVGEWEELGRALGLKDWQLTMINRDYPGVGEKSYQMLKTWVWCNPEQATLENLKKALEDMIVDRRDLAAKYCTVENNDTNLQNNGGENANVPDSTNDGESNSD